MLRLFVALELPDDIRQSAIRIAAGLPDARWVAPQNLHVTLRFIGEVDEHTAEDIDAQLSGVRGRALELSLNGLGCFESRGRVRALWARIAPSEPLSQLQGRVEQAVRRADIEADAHKFLPHVTLARFKGLPARHVAPYLEHYGHFRAGPFAAEHFTLFRSQMGHGGSHYEPLARYDLDTWT